MGIIAFFPFKLKKIDGKNDFFKKQSIVSIIRFLCNVCFVKSLLYPRTLSLHLAVAGVNLRSLLTATLSTLIVPQSLFSLLSP